MLRAHHSTHDVHGSCLIKIFTMVTVVEGIQLHSDKQLDEKH